MFNPIHDGVDHINIYTKANTHLGTFLTNLANVRVPTEDGEFASLEGYWYWLSTKDDRLRNLGGFAAKKLGKTLKREMGDESVFRDKIYKASWAKLHTYPDCLKLFRESTLPFTHYYVYGGTAVDANFKWIVEMWEIFRSYIQNYYNKIEENNYDY